MRIRPIVITSLGTCLALAAIAIVMGSSTPQEAGIALVRLVWFAIFLAGWGIAATLLLVARQSMSQAVWVGLVPALSFAGILSVTRQGLMTQRLLLPIVLATLILAFLVWWRLRHSNTHD